MYKTYKVRWCFAWCSNKVRTKQDFLDEVLFLGFQEVIFKRLFHIWELSLVPYAHTCMKHYCRDLLNIVKVIRVHSLKCFSQIFWSFYRNLAIMADVVRACLLRVWPFASKAMRMRNWCGNPGHFKFLFWFNGWFECRYELLCFGY